MSLYCIYIPPIVSTSHQIYRTRGRLGRRRVPQFGLLTCLRCGKTLTEGDHDVDGDLALCAGCQRVPYRSKGVLGRWLWEKRHAYLARFQAQCQHCKGRFPVEAMDIHHCDPTRKRFGGLGLPPFLQASWGELQRELAGCWALCACCHRIHHHELRRQAAVDTAHATGVQLDPTRPTD